MREHFEHVAERLLKTELAGPDPFVVEIGSNDGIMLEKLSRAGVRHLGIDPSGQAASIARDKEIRVLVEFFEETSAAAVRSADGPADVIFSANTISHIAYLDSIFRGIEILLAPDGVFVFEDRYLGDIVEHTTFDQIYDEHFYLFAVRSVSALAARFGFELVNAEHLPVHGGSIRYTVARPGARRRAACIDGMLAREERLGLGVAATYVKFAAGVDRIRDQLVALLEDLRSKGCKVVGYGATARSATVTNYCGIGPELVPFICDSTPGKQGCITPGSHIPVRPSEEFSSPYPDYALLFAWNHADEIFAKERQFRDGGGKWILYTPDVHVL